MTTPINETSYLEFRNMRKPGMPLSHPKPVAFLWPNGMPPFHQPTQKKKRKGRKEERKQERILCMFPNDDYCKVSQNLDSVWTMGMFMLSTLFQEHCRDVCVCVCVRARLRVHARACGRADLTVSLRTACAGAEMRHTQIIGNPRHVGFGYPTAVYPSAGGGHCLVSLVLPIAVSLS